MARLKFFLHIPKSKEETPIYLSITYNNGRSKVKTQQKIKPKAWNNKDYSVRRNYTEYAEVQKELDRIEKIAKIKISDLREEFGKLPAHKELKSIIETALFGTRDLAGIDFWEYFQNYIDRLQRKISPRTGKYFSKSTIDVYNQSKKVLKEFEQDTGTFISFTTITNQLYDDIVAYFETIKNYSINTIGKHIKHYKTVISAAKDVDGIKVSEGYNRKYWVVSQVSKKAEEIVSLNEEELEELSLMELKTNTGFDKARDILLIGAWTGLRIVDIKRLSVKHIDLDKNTIRITTQKTNKLVTIPLHPVVLEVLKKHQYGCPTLSKVKANEYIKDVCKQIDSLHNLVEFQIIKGGKNKTLLKKRYELIGTHTGRRSFATNHYRRGIPIQEIMAITGHSKESDFLRYIGMTGEEHANNLAKRWKEWYG